VPFSILVQTVRVSAELLLQLNHCISSYIDMSSVLEHQ